MLPLFGGMNSSTVPVMGAALRAWVLTGLLACGCGSASTGSLPQNPTTPATPATPGRGVPSATHWVSFYGTAQQMGDLVRVAQTFGVINLDADPDQHNFTAAQITTLKADGANRVISYLNLGACERSRSYWQTVPAGFVGCGANAAAQLGPYAGYPDETWMNVGNLDYQHLLLDYVAPRLVVQGVDGFFFDNLEVIEHAPGSGQPVCEAACSQGGLDLVRRLREKYPALLFVMQNATGLTTQRGTTGGLSFPSLLDGISHEEVYTPYDAQSESELLAWQQLTLRPGGRSFWIATEEYVGSCGNATAARDVYVRSRARGFMPYATDQSAGQRVVCYWGF
jgi:cysteinyl-tRNA synthetase